MMRGQVTVITVTYGDRWRYLSRLLDFMAEQPGVARVIVVDNASKTPVAPLVAQAAAQWRSPLCVEVLSEPRNTGSAAAYGRALRHAVAMPAGEFIWLLDDDNMPEPAALERLLARTPTLGPCDVLLALRTDRSYLVDAVTRRQSLRHRVNAFCGNDILHALARKLRLAAPRRPAGPNAEGEIEADYAPYGGMLFRRALPEAIGYPNAAYFLYADDYEYVCRIRAAGGTVRVCADSRVKDLEQVWFDASEAAISPWFSPRSSDFRVFYSVRNQVALEHAWLVTRPATYVASGLLAVLRLALQAWAAGVPAKLIAHRLRLVGRAARLGWAGRLGEVPQLANTR